MEQFGGKLFIWSASGSEKLLLARKLYIFYIRDPVGISSKLSAGPGKALYRKSLLLRCSAEKK